MVCLDFPRAPFGTPWPDQLQTLLGSKYYVMNFGHGGSYVRKSDLNIGLLTIGPGSYWDTQSFKYASYSEPDIVIVMLGTNDGHSRFWSEGGWKRTFEADYRSILQHDHNRRHSDGDCFGIDLLKDKESLIIGVRYKQ